MPSMELHATGHLLPKTQHHYAGGSQGLKLWHDGVVLVQIELELLTMSLMRRTCARSGKCSTTL